MVAASSEEVRTRERAAERWIARGEARARIEEVKAIEESGLKSKLLGNLRRRQGGGQEGRKDEQVPETRRGDRDGGGSRDANDSRGSDGAILAAIADLSQQMRGLETRFTRQVGDLEVRVAELNL